MCGFAASLMGSTSDHYIPDMVLQGCTQLPKCWEANLRQDLSLSAHHPLLDQEVSEAVCIIANIDTWFVYYIISLKTLHLPNYALPSGKTVITYLCL
jgi:hypothetical protein